MLKFYKNLGYKMENLNNAKLYYEQAISIPIFYQLKKKNSNLYNQSNKKISSKINLYDK
jgi:dTDP-4-amino-4,6-dideoxygalactose transaminase